MPRKKRTLSPFELMDDDFDDTSSQSSRNGNPPIQRNAANARERARMRVLSSAFGRLKTKLPNIPADTKLSKLDTLRLATMYIKQLKTVVEGEAASRTTNAEHMERSLNNHHENNSANCYLNLNMGAQSMNWPFGFHHHLTNTSLIRSTSALSLNNNWCTRDKSSNTEEQRIDQGFYENENYQQQSSSFMQHTTLCPQYNKNNHQHNHWCSQTPSPELDSTSSSCLNFENSQHQLEHTRHPHYYHHHQQQQLISNHHHNLSHLQPASTQPSTFQLQHNFHYHTSQEQEQQHQPTISHHLHHNGFANSTNFQSTSIR